MAGYSAYKIGEKTVTLTASVAGNLDTEAPYPALYFFRGDAEVTGSINAGWCGGFFNVNVYSSYGAGNAGSTWSLTATIFGQSDTKSHNPVMADGVYDLTFEGTLSASIDCDIVAVVETGGLADDILDSPEYTKIRIELWPQPDQDVTCSFSMFGDTATRTVNTGASPGPLSYGSTVYATSTASRLNGTNSGSFRNYQSSGTSSSGVSIGASHSLGGGSFAGLSRSSNAYNCSASAATGDNQVSCSTTATEYDPGRQQKNFIGSAEAIATRSQRPDRSLGLSGVLRTLESSYPESLRVLLTGITPNSLVASGGFDVSHAQKEASNNVSAETGGRSSSGTGTGYIEFDLTDTQAANNTFSDYSPVRCQIQADGSSESLTARGEDARITRILMRGWRWDAMSLKKASSFLVDDCSGLNPTTPTGWGGAWTILDNPVDGLGRPRTLISVASSIIQVSRNPSYSGTDMSAVKVRRTFTHDVTLGTYRYLVVRMRSDQAVFSPPTLVIGGKTFIGRACDKGAWYEVEYDLSCEYLPNTESSIEDSLWRFRGNQADGTDYLPDTEKTFFGVHRCSSFVLDQLSPTAVYELDNIELIQKAQTAKVDFLPAFYRGRAIYVDNALSDIDVAWPQEEFPTRYSGSSGEVVTNYFARRFLLGNVDGQQGLEITDSRYVTIDQPSALHRVLNFSPATISGLIFDVNLVNSNGLAVNPGWEATNLLPMPTTGCGSYSGGGIGPLRDCLLNSSRPATELYGGGAFWNGSTWQHRFGAVGGAQQGAVAVGETATTIPAQVLLDEIDWYPSCGDVFEHGTSDPNNKTLILKAAAILRGAAHGLIMDEDFLPVRGVEVGVLTSGANALFGQGRSGVLGYYRTGAPNAKTQSSHKIAVLSGAFPRPSTNTVLYARKYQRVSFQVLRVCKSLFLPRPDLFFPFAPQFSDPNLVPVEEWRRIAGPTSSDDENEDPARMPDTVSVRFG